LNPFDAIARPAQEDGAETAVCSTCGARSVGLCRALDAAGLEDLLADTQQVARAPRDILFDEGAEATHVFTLIEGTAKLTRLLPDGREQVVGFRYAGDIIGYAPGRQHEFAAQLLTPARVCRIERRRLDELMRRHPPLERRLLALCVQELATTQEQLVTVGRRTAEARVAAFLLSLAAASDRRRQGDSLEMPMTRADIADFLGLTIETVSRILTGFRRRGLVREPSHGRIQLLRREALVAMTEG
jgi:CRP/FNR family transcriptional regulator